MTKVYLYKNAQNEFTVEVRERGKPKRYAYFSHLVDAVDYINMKGYKNVTENF